MRNSDYYLEFENSFRGTREEIIDSLSIYDELIKVIINNKSRNKLQLFSLNY